MKKLVLTALIAMLIAINPLLAQWEKCSNGITGDMMIYNIKAKGDTVFIGTHNNGFYMSTNQGDSWIYRSTGLPKNPVWGLDFSGDNIFVGTESGVYLSTNAGTTWITKSNGLTFPEIHTLKIIDNNTILAGTKGGGVFLSTNNGDNWIRKVKGLPNNGNIDVQCFIADGTDIYRYMGGRCICIN